MFRRSQVYSWLRGRAGCGSNHDNSIEVRVILISNRHADGNHIFAGEEAWAGLRGIAIIMMDLSSYLWVKGPWKKRLRGKVPNPGLSHFA
jgi:hypothetical protein